MPIQEIASYLKTKARFMKKESGFKINPGSDLLSHTVTSIVPSALRGLTAVFGMGTGVSPSLLPPENFFEKSNRLVPVHQQAIFINHRTPNRHPIFTSGKPA